MTAALAPRRLSARCGGFTLTEVLVAMTLVAILAMLAVPSMRDRIARAQVVEAAKLVDQVVKEPVATYWRLSGEMPADNEAAGVPAPQKIIGNFVTSVTVEDGAAHIVFGNDANGKLQGRTLTLRPAVVPDARQVPPAWVCAAARVPAGMQAHGRDRTDLEPALLPVNCRPAGG